MNDIRRIFKSCPTSYVAFNQSLISSSVGADTDGFTIVEPMTVLAFVAIQPPVSKNALDISIAEADRGEVTHYDSLEDLIREIG